MRSMPMPASICEFVQCASPCNNLSISVRDVAPDVQDLELPQYRVIKGLCPDVKASCPFDDSSTLPAPKKFSKKSSDITCGRDTTSPTSSVQIKRAVRQAIGSALIKDEAAVWSSCTEVRQDSATDVAKLFCFTNPGICQ